MYNIYSKMLKKYLIWHLKLNDFVKQIITITHHYSYDKKLQIYNIN